MNLVSLADDECGRHGPRHDRPDGKRISHPLPTLSPALAALLDCPADRLAVSLAGRIPGLTGSRGGLRAPPISSALRRNSALTSRLCRCIPGRGENHSQQ